MTVYETNAPLLDDDGNPVLDENGRPVRHNIPWTQEEIDAFEVERAAIVADRVFTPLQFMELFTDEEQLAIVTATLAVPAIKLWYDKMLAAQEVRIQDPRTQAGMAALVGAGLLTQERVDEITGT